MAAEFAIYVQLNPQLADEVQYVASQVDDAEEVADIVAAHLQIGAAEKQALLETESTQERLLALLEAVAEENAVLGLEHEIMSKVQHRIESAQRQLLLHEKLRVHPRRDRGGAASARTTTTAQYHRLLDGGRPPAGGAHPGRSASSASSSRRRP